MDEPLPHIIYLNCNSFPPSRMIFLKRFLLNYDLDSLDSFMPNFLNFSFEYFDLVVHQVDDTKLMVFNESNILINLIKEHINFKIHRI